jgi:hypothetical protein
VRNCHFLAEAEFDFGADGGELDEFAERGGQKIVAFVAAVRSAPAVLSDRRERRSESGSTREHSSFNGSANGRG